MTDSMIWGLADEITSYGYVSENAIRATERLYKSFPYSALNAALKRDPAGRGAIVIKIAELHGIG
jgi:hypothetical protein